MTEVTTSFQTDIKYSFKKRNSVETGQKWVLLNDKSLGIQIM